MKQIYPESGFVKGRSLGDRIFFIVSIVGGGADDSVRLKRVPIN